MKQLNDWEQIALQVHLQDMSRYDWKVIEQIGKDHPVPSSYVEGTKLQFRNITPSDEVMAYEQELHLDPLMSLRYCKRMKFKEVPKGYVIMPGNPDDIEAERQEFFKGDIE